ncbi:hypothetical protein NKI94_19275 [Mesorhizobium australicum]|uniref:hypothetical protein n=1 Tax=Mesorhizobium australicum TaxID=536018 RepID=UPI00333AE976
MERSDVWFIAVVAATLGFVAGLAWTDFRSDGNPLEAYQTLIVGLAAVAAAYATINAMNRTDDKAQKRHEDLVRLTLRADKIAADRAAYTAPLFRGLAETIAALNREFSRDRIMGSTHVDGAHRAAAVAATLGLLVNSHAISNSNRLFGARMSADYEALLHCMETGNEKGEDVLKRLNNDFNSSVPYVLDLVGQLNTDVRPRSLAFASHLDDLGKAYA